MISQRCPKCRSNRIRRGYRPTPIWSKILFRYNLLCDGCNWEFAGFAVPGTVENKPNRKTKMRKDKKESEANNDFEEESAVKSIIEKKNRRKPKKKAVIKKF